MGVPNLKSYHQAAVLDQLKFWWSSSLDHVWCPIEHSLLGSSLQGTVGVILLGFTPKPSPYLTIRAALSTWKNLHPQLLKSHSSDLAILPLVSLEPLSPDLSLSHWMTAGISILGCLMDANSPRTFQSLQQSYGLPKSDFYIYLRTQSILTTINKGTHTTYQWI